VVSLRALNDADREAFVRTVGPLFEGLSGPWIAEQAWPRRPFASLAGLHAALRAVMEEAPRERQLALIRAHPDLAGKAALAGPGGGAPLTAQSQGEQAAAGLDRLTPEEMTTFTRLNAAYRERFDFPFVICAREHTKEAILASFAARLTHSRDQEVGTALGEIAKIAWLRLLDAVSEP
jgi:OHCU decarboxylase